MGATANDAIAIMDQFGAAIEVLAKLGKRTLTVASRQLDEYAVCDKVWRHIGMPVGLNRVRFDMLHDMKVEIMPDRIRDLVESNLDNIRQLATEA
jgi:hypothetical protein